MISATRPGVAGLLEKRPNAGDANVARRRITLETLDGAQDQLGCVGDRSFAESCDLGFEGAGFADEAMDEHAAVDLRQHLQRAVG